MTLDLEEVFASLNPQVKAVARDLGIETETAVQKEAIPVILSRSDALIISPTGSGKTEAALLPIFESILSDRKSGGIRALYVTPLRALNRDMRRRIEMWGSRLGISVEVRHGDTPQSERRKQAIHPPEILITTPETLQVLLVGSRLRQGLSNCEWVVVDEIHQLASNRRGAQLSIALERLQNQIGSNRRIQRIGLSATVGNKEVVAKFLAGSNGSPKIVDASSIAKMVQYTIELIEPTEADEKVASEIFTSPQTAARLSRAADLIRGHSGTLVFVNSRTVAELLGARLSSFGVKASVHHGSLAREERERVEQDFKAGKVQALICTSTLELGIDIGSVDLVIQYMSPRQVNSLIQRVGRSGHSLKKSSEGITLAVSPEDSLEAIVISKEALRGNLESVVIQECALDVLAHQIAGLLLEDGDRDVQSIHSLVTSSYAYKNLTLDALKSVIRYMEALGYLRYEPERVIIRSSKCRRYYHENLSMIPDERRYYVIDVTNQAKVGILGEEFMILHAKQGLHFIIKGRVWEIASIQGENVYVTPVKDPMAAIPGWDGELMPIPQRVAEAVGAERGLVENKLQKNKDYFEFTKIWNADRNAREKIFEEMKSQAENYAVPTDKRIVVEKLGRYVIVHTSAGDRINLTLGEFFEETLLRKGLIRHWWQDGYRILIELTNEEIEAQDVADLLFDYNVGTAGFLKAVVRKHFPFGYYLKFIAERFGALKRGMMLSEEALRDLVTKFRFTPVYDETLREALILKVDEGGSLLLLQKCKSKEIEVSAIASGDNASPLAKYIVNRYGEPDDPEGMLTTVESIKSAVAKEVLSLLCFKCGELYEFVKVGSLPGEPKCEKCGHSLLSPIFYGAKFAQGSLKKKIEGKPLSEQEADILTRARRAADLVLSYGKAGIIAQSVYGIGPQTASKVLSRMETDEEKFYQDLIDAKLVFLRTRQYWD